MNGSPEKFPLIGACVVEVKVGEKWIQCTNPKTEPTARVELTAKRKAAPDCTFRLMMMTETGFEEVPS